MATKSFVTDFKFTQKTGPKFLRAIENSRTREHVFNQNVTTVRDEESINSIMDSFLKKDSSN